MRSIINIIKAAFRASLSGPGLLGWLVALVKPIAKALNMASDIDLLANYFGSAGKFLETGWGTLTSVILGAVIIGYAVYLNMRHAAKDESHRISILELLSKASNKKAPALSSGRNVSKSTATRKVSRVARRNADENQQGGARPPRVVPLRSGRAVVAMRLMCR
jgi:hypothetical protein